MTVKVNDKKRWFNSFWYKNDQSFYKETEKIKRAVSRINLDAKIGYLKSGYQNNVIKISGSSREHPRFSRVIDYDIWGNLWRMLAKNAGVEMSTHVLDYNHDFLIYEGLTFGKSIMLPPEPPVDLQPFVEAGQVLANIVRQYNGGVQMYNKGTKDEMDKDKRSRELNSIFEDLELVTQK